MAAQQLDLFAKAEEAYQKSMRDRRALEHHLGQLDLHPRHIRVLMAIQKEGQRFDGIHPQLGRVVGSAWVASQTQIGKAAGCIRTTANQVLSDLENIGFLWTKVMTARETGLKRDMKGYVVLWFNVWNAEPVARPTPVNALIEYALTCNALPDVSSDLCSNLSSHVSSDLSAYVSSDVSSYTCHDPRTKPVSRSRVTGFRNLPWKADAKQLRDSVRSDGQFVGLLWSEAVKLSWIVETEANRQAFFGAAYEAAHAPPRDDGQPANAMAILSSRVKRKHLGGEWANKADAEEWARKTIKLLVHGPDYERTSDLDNDGEAEARSVVDQIEALQEQRYSAAKVAAQAPSGPKTDWKALRAQYGPLIDAASLDELLALDLPETARKQLCRPNGEDADGRRSELIRPTLLLAFQQREQQAATPDSEPSELENVTT